MTGRLLCAATLVLSLAAVPGFGQSGTAAKPDPRTLLDGAKSASGGANWDALRTQHSKVSIQTAGVTGNAERWSDIATGRSTISYRFGPIAGTAGFDGKAAWVQDSAGESRAETAAASRELAVNAAYRDRLAFWYPERAPAEIAYQERALADGAEFDVIRITPEGGRAFELWINRETHLIERLVERETRELRTEIYMDLRDVQGVKIPFRVRATRGDPRHDETVIVDTMEFNASLASVSFARPAPPKPDFAFPAGREFVEVPIEVHNGHLFLKVRLNGKGPYLMLFDSSGINVLLPQVAAALGDKAAGALGAGEAKQDPGITMVERLEFGGIVVERQVFATLDLALFMRRVEGLDHVAGLIGYELFRRFPVKLDYARSRAIFYDPAKFKYAGTGTRVPFEFRGTVPQVTGRVDGIAGKFAIDTGSRGSLTLNTPFVEANGLVEKLGATQEAITGAGVGGHVRALLARAGTLEFGGVEASKPVTALSLQTKGALADPDRAGNIGYGILRQFNVTFDYANHVLYFENNADYGKTDVYDRAGMWLERGARGVEVVDVVAGSPAAAAGVKAGDAIIAVDGKAWTALPLTSVRAAMKAAPGTRVRVKLARGAESIVTLRDLI